MVKYLAMATPVDKSKMRDTLRRIFEFIFGFKNKKGEVITSWILPADSLGVSSGEFYAAIEEQVALRKIPSIKVSRTRFAEGGLLSDQRIYLRLMRERLAIDTCAAPFGSLYFFSCRTVHIPALVRLWHILASVVLLWLAFVLLVIPLGFLFGVIALVTLVFALAGVLRNASEGAFSDLDAILLNIPVVSTIYEDWFRQETYYREDTRALYLEILPSMIKELVEQTCAAKGVKLIKQTGSGEVMTELMKRRPGTTPEA